MSKISQPLKALINAAHSRPGTIPAPQHIASVYEQIALDAASKKVGTPAWLCASTAVTVTMNSPESLSELYRFAVSSSSESFGDGSKVQVAEFMREIGLKCIGFNGVPRTINCLGAFFNGLPTEVKSGLKQRKPRRNLTSSNIEDTISRGKQLWDSIYYPYSDRLIGKLAQSHPDLPIYIIEGAYGGLFSDPPANPSSCHSQQIGSNIGRVLTSIAAIASLRSQTGVGPQVLSHVFGLRKAFEDGSAEDESVVSGGQWLASDEGSIWLLNLIDRLALELSQNGCSSSQSENQRSKAKL